MALLSLLLGLALCWAAGTLALAAAWGHRETGDGLLLAGAGWFLGVALTGFFLGGTDHLTDRLSWGLVATVLAVLIAATGLLAWWRSRRTAPVVLRSAPGRNWPAATGRGRWLLAIVFALGCTNHFAFSALEIITQPVFPWDGWTVWVYRAKAWFFTEHLAPVVGTGRWMAATSAEVFTTPALRYPVLPSLIPLWAALSLGTWHEALVNLPVLAGAAAIALALAGYLRLAGAGPLAALGACYLLFSTPLFGAHMSLGGYADIWMAGYAGLGMAGLLCGLLTGRAPVAWLGALLLVLGTLVKVEGLVWLAAGLAITALVRLRARTILILFAVAAIALLLAWVTGHTVVQLPGLGKVGYNNGWLWVPLKGHITLRRHDVGGAYLDNAFFRGSWHLLWPLAIAALCLALARPRERLTRVAGAFFLVFVGLQAAIFVFTTEGAWAKDYTAINRMPLQMLPAVLFLVVTIFALRWRDRPQGLGHTRTRRALALGFVGGAALTVLGLVAWQASVHEEGEAPVTDAGAEALTFVVGSGRKEDGTVVIERYRDGIALLSSGPVNLAARDHYLLRVDLDYDEDIESLDQAPAFFWRRANQPRQVSRVTLTEPGLVDLSRSHEWRGRIVEFGFFFVENRGEPARLSGARLEGRSLSNTLEFLPVQWTHFDSWTQRSAHWLPGGAENQAVSLTAVVLTFTLLAALLAWWLAGRRHALACLSVMLLAGWGVLDIRWSLDRLKQGERSLDQLMTQSVEERMGTGELGVFYPYLQRLDREFFGEGAQRVLIVPDPELEKYFGLRAKYQLLPNSTAVMKRLPAPNRLDTLDYVLFLGDFTRGDPAQLLGETPRQMWGRLGQGGEKAMRVKLKLVDRDVQGTLFRIRKSRRGSGAGP